MPSLLNQLGEVQILLQDSEADGLPASKYATRFVALEALLRAILGSLNNNLATAYRGNVDGRLRQTVDDRFAAAVASTRALLDALSTSVVGGEIKGVDLAVLKQLSITAVENALNALNVGQVELARLLDVRIDTLRSRLYENLAVTAVLVGLSVLIAIMIHRHIVRPLNLVMNASDAMDLVPDRDRILRIGSERHDHNGVLITVEDSGTGIEPQNIERIFEPLFTTKSTGMGMGLSICRSIIESHGGRLWVSPGQHHGTVFQFALPVGSLKGV